MDSMETHGESSWSPHGVCGNVWGSVKYSPKPRCQGLVLAKETWGGGLFSGRGGPILVGYTGFGIVGMRSGDVQGGGAGCWCQKPNPSPSSLDSAKKKVGGLCF